MTYKNKIQILPIIIFFITAILLLVWGVSHSQKHMNHDIAYLTNSATHLLAGERMSETYYEVNPPLSIIVYIPSALMMKYTSIPIYYAVFIQTLALVIISSIFIYSLFKHIPWIKKQEKILFLNTYVLINTLMVGYEFGQKDQYIILFLFPLSLLLIITTYKIPLPSLLKWIVLITGGIFILIKPHYGLIPAAIFIHRGFVQRRINIIFDKDFLCLGILFFLYIGFILLFFNDYITQILPDTLSFYVKNVSQHAMIKGVFYAYIVLIFTLISAFIFKKPQGFILFLFLMSLLSIIPFIIQGRGVDYHIIPARNFFIYGLSLFFIPIFMKAFKYLHLETHQHLSILGSYLIILLIIYPFYTNPLSRMSHNEYKQTQIVKLLQQCSNSDTVFIYDGRAYITQLATIYANKTNASRFIYPWFIIPFLNIEQEIKQGKQSKLSKEELKIIIKKYGDMMAQDFKKYEPGIILLSPIKYFKMIDESFNIKPYFSKYSDEFASIWKNYDLVKEVEIDRTPYLARENKYSIGIYQVYRHKKCL